MEEGIRLTIGGYIMKRKLSLLLVALLVATLIPMTSFAAEATKSLSLEVKDGAKAVSELGGEMATFGIENLGSIKQNIIITLEDEAKFDYSAKSKTTVIVDGKQINGSGLKSETITLKYGTDFSSTSKFIEVKPYVIGDNIEIGDEINVNIKLSGSDNVISSATIANVEDDKVNVTVVESGKSDIPNIIAGNKAAIKVTIEGTRGSITLGRPYYISMEGATISPNAPTYKTGLQNFDFEDKSSMVSDFILEPTSNTKMEFIVDIYTSPDSESGKASMKISSRDLGGEYVVDIANIVKAYDLSTDITTIKRGELQGSSDIVITEGKAGTLKVDNYLYILFDKELVFEDKPTISATNGLKLGDINWISSDDRKKTGIVVKVIANSTKSPSIITLTDMNAQMSKTAIEAKIYKASLWVSPQLDINNPMDNKAIVKYNEFDYAKCDGGSNQIVFKLDSATYIVGGVARALEAPVFTKNDRTMLPVGPLALALNIEVDYDASSKTATFRNPIDGKKASITEGSDIIVIDNYERKMDTAAISKNGRIFVPVASVAEAFGSQIQWMPVAKEIVIN